MISQCLNPDCLHVNLEATIVCSQCSSKLLLIDRYRAVSLLGQGGFGRTFLAIDEFKPSKPRCVIKQFLPEVKGKKALKKASELFEQEASRLDELGKHEQIPELLAFFNQEDRKYLIQEYIDGDDLAKELKVRGVFDQGKIKELLHDLLSVLEFIHENNIIHRDIKPENIIRRKQDGKLVLVDFGAAKEILSDNTSAVGTIIGSAAYIAPEQAVGKAKFASDLYSLGATCLHLLTDVEPTELFDVAEGEWIWRDYLNDNHIDYELSRVLDKLVEGATKRRFQSVAEVLAVLDGNTNPNAVHPHKSIQPRHNYRSSTNTVRPTKVRSGIFCQKLSELIGRELRLPTEAEWEYACRGKTTTPFHYGLTIDTELANYNGEDVYASGFEGENRRETTGVDRFFPNRFGLYDLHGNVAEWCADSWHNSYKNAPVDGSARTSSNPKDLRVLRGGSWLHLPGSCRCAQRIKSEPKNKSDAFGFRIAASI